MIKQNIFTGKLQWKNEKNLQQIHKEVNEFEFHGIMASCDLDTIIESQGF